MQSKHCVPWASCYGGLSVVLALTQPTSSHTGEYPTVALSVLLPWTIGALQAKLIGIAAPLLIAVLFWRCTIGAELESASRVAIVLLAVQTALAFLVAEELQFVVAVEAGLLLSPGKGALWVAGQALAAWIMSSAHPELMSWIIPSSGSRTQRLVGIGVFMLVALLYNFLAYSLGLLAGMEGRQRRALSLTCDRLEEANRRLRAAQRTVEEAARTQERLSLARDLHDAIGHQLSALSINLQIASRVSHDRARRHVLEAYQLVGVLLADVRSLVTATRETEVGDFASALGVIADRVPSPAIHLEIGPAMRDLEPKIGHALFRCAQEIITNAVRHAGASNIWIQANREGLEYVLSAWDDGRGNAALAIGNGLRGIDERMRECGGSCMLRNRLDAGFEVTLKVPVGREEAA